MPCTCYDCVTDRERAKRERVIWARFKSRHAVKIEEIVKRRNPRADKINDRMRQQAIMTDDFLYRTALGAGLSLSMVR